MNTAIQDERGRASAGLSESSAGVGRAVATFVGAVVLTCAALFLAGRSGATLARPVGATAWELAVTLIAIAILGWGVATSVREKKLSRVFLMAVASGTAFWQETYGDWGTYLLYSPAFSTYDWGHTRWTSPVQCWWFIAGYVFFYTTFLTALGGAFHVIKSRWPQRNPFILTAVAALPLFYVFDVALEGTAHGLGWWQYQYVFGPSLTVGTGHFPLLWPILEQVPFMVIAVYFAAWRNRMGEDIFEVAARAVTRRKPSQVSILVSWIVILNVTFFVSTILPLMLLRVVAGPASLVVP